MKKLCNTLLIHSITSSLDMEYCLRQLGATISGYEFGLFGMTLSGETRM